MLFVGLLLDCVFIDVYNPDYQYYIEDSLGILTMWAVMSYSLGINGDCFLILSEREIFLREI